MTDEREHIHRRADSRDVKQGEAALDTLADGRAFHTLNIVDDFTRECVAIEVYRSLPGLRVTPLLDRLQSTIGLPASNVVDNEPEFAGRTLNA